MNLTLNKCKCNADSFGSCLQYFLALRVLSKRLKSYFSFFFQPYGKKSTFRIRSYLQSAWGLLLCLGGKGLRN